MAVEQSIVSRDQIFFNHMVFEFSEEDDHSGQPLKPTSWILSPSQLLVNHEPEQLHCNLQAFHGVTTQGAHPLCFGFI